MSVLYEEYLANHYTNSMTEIRQTGKAGKDVVGASYERLRKEWLRAHDLDVATITEAARFKKMFNKVYNADQWIVHPQSRKLLAVEEDKGHYVDKCFYKRAVFNAMELFFYCEENNIKAPYFLLSCPTKYNPPEMTNMFNPELREMFKKKFKYFYHCDHGRVRRGVYLKDEQSPFVVERKLVNAEKVFLKKLRGKTKHD